MVFIGRWFGYKVSGYRFVYLSPHHNKNPPSWRVFIMVSYDSSNQRKVGSTTRTRLDEFESCKFQNHIWGEVSELILCLDTIQISCN